MGIYPKLETSDNLSSAYNEYDGTTDELWREVEVVRPIEADMGMEVVCPPVLTPGEFFLCTADHSSKQD